jgi:hypothetical protein
MAVKKKKKLVKPPPDEELFDDEFLDRLAAKILDRMGPGFKPPYCPGYYDPPPVDMHQGPIDIWRSALAEARIEVGDEIAALTKYPLSPQEIAQVVDSMKTSKTRRVSLKDVGRTIALVLGENELMKRTGDLGEAAVDRPSTLSSSWHHGWCHPYKHHDCWCYPDHCHPFRHGWCKPYHFGHCGPYPILYQEEDGPYGGGGVPKCGPPAYNRPPVVLPPCDPPSEYRCHSWKWWWWM